ncbi:MAG: aminopeptidase [Lachnospiraceae bacterium]|nr:aminopeptidase [Lachnospiraceae bacterium]
MSDAAWNTADEPLIGERYALVTERIAGIPSEHLVPEIYQDYFEQLSVFLLKTADIYEKKTDGRLRERTLAQCEADQRELYRLFRPDCYETSYANPAYAARMFGQEAGQLLTLLCSEMEGCIAWAFQGRQQELTLLLELYVQVYNCLEEDGSSGRQLLPYTDCAGRVQQSGKNSLRAPVQIKEARDTVYWFFHDYSEIFVENQIRDMICPEDNFFIDIVMHADLSDLRYLYQYGLPASENDIGIASFMNRLPDEQIQAMADTYTEGYRIGFEAAGIDLSKKKTVELHFPIGFERMMRAAILNFEKLGLKPCVVREAVSSFANKGRMKRGIYSASVNRQYDFDHREDRAYYFDKSFVERRLEVLRTVFEQHKQEALAYAGPAVVEVFGEMPFSPEPCEGAIHYDEAQQQLNVWFASESGQITYRYIPGGERSYTIIAFPTPEIGDRFEDIFSETVKINTLNYRKYQMMQQRLIDVLDKAERVHIVGRGENHTDLTVSILPLEDSDTQTAFENCVADVNIPVGEVFTSPVLNGTNGILHVTEVFLNGLQYRNLEITFRDGMIDSYTCTNFASEEENRKYIKDNVLMHHDTLPMGEFAIGTNTAAYRMARTYGIADKLPILIAEKTGPHFAVGDTCYSHEEEVVRKNPDGKFIVAKENEVSAFRGEDPAKAYFNCHTDITIPYDELGAITAVCPDGTQTDIIRDGLFRVEGTEELNEPLRCEMK